MLPNRRDQFMEPDYAQLLQTLQNFGYRDVSLDALDPRQPHMFLRHDVDLSLEYALRLGEVEFQQGVRSTFYVLMSTQIYNIASAVSRRILEQLGRLGHTVALHFDATAYDGDRGELEQQAEHECRILEQLTGQPVTSISFHRPVRDFLNMPGTFAGRRHTYEPHFFSGVGYISDSNGGWHHGHPLDHPAVQARTGIQLLTHPIWWMQSERLTPAEVIERLRVERGMAERLALANTVTAYKKWLAEEPA